MFPENVIRILGAFVSGSKHVTLTLSTKSTSVDNFIGMYFKYLDNVKKHKYITIFHNFQLKFKLYTTWTKTVNKVATANR
mgnify:CR=1 FL=1